jgi:hypothetical protein
MYAVERTTASMSNISERKSMGIKKNKNDMKNEISFLKNAVKVTNRKLSVKFSRRKNSVSFEASKGNRKLKQLWNKDAVSAVSNEHSHEKNKNWTVSVSHDGVPTLKVDFRTRDAAREFSRSFKNSLAIG